MTFILITGSIMAISIFLIYRLCRFFNIEMKWTSLVLCAVMAFIVNGMAITMSPFLDRGHYLRLGILVITAAAVVTIFNERMLRREEALAGNCTVLPTEQLPVEEEPPTEDILPAAMQEPVAETSPSEPAVPVEAAPAEQPAAVQEVPQEENSAAPQKNNEAEKAVEEAKLAAQAIAEKEAKLAAEKAEKEAQAIAEAKARKEAKERAEQKKREAAARKKAEAEAKAKAAAEAKAKAKAKARAEAEEKARQELAAKRQAHEQELKQELSSMDSLDALLDFAYEAKDAQPKDAIFAYHEAISRYGDDDYTPFLVIELGNLYKEQANYSGAIAAYKQALTMPIIAKNDAMCQEFTKNIHYLGTVQDILAKHAALSTPFPQIPGDIMQEIETEFQAHSGSAK